MATRDTADIAEHVCRVLEDEAWRTAASVLAGSQAQERFGLERMIDETIAFYKHAAGRTRALEPIA
jgi:hypothetical protein